MDRRTYLCDSNGAEGGYGDFGIADWEYETPEEAYAAHQSMIAEQNAAAEDTTAGPKGAAGVGPRKEAEKPKEEPKPEKKPGETEEQYQRRRRRRRPTLLTTGQGVLGNAPGRQKTLLGE